MPYWADSLDKSVQIGRHIFYRLKDGLGASAAFRQRYAGVEPVPLTPSAVEVSLEAIEDTENTLAPIETNPLQVTTGELITSQEPKTQLAADAAAGTLLIDGTTSQAAVPAKRGETQGCEQGTGSNYLRPIGANDMLGLAKRLGCKILQASTSEVYGDPSVHPQSEEYWGHVNPIGPRSCYDEGKRCAETLFFDYHRQHRLPIKVARIFNTYGPRMHPADGRVVSNFIMQALKNEPITVYGDGSQTRSFCYVDDLVAGLTALMETGPEITGPINIGNPNEFTVRELAEKVIHLTNSTSKIIEAPLPQDDPKQRQPDISKAKRDLGWEPAIQLEQGLVKTIDYFRKFI